MAWFECLACSVDDVAVATDSPELRRHICRSAFRKWLKVEPKMGERR
jgi:hypothetical protein